MRGNVSWGNGDPCGSQQTIPHVQSGAAAQRLKCGGPGPHDLEEEGRSRRRQRTTWAPRGPPLSEEDAGGSSSSIKVVTFNANCWRTFFKYVKKTDADIMVGQEIGLSTKDEIAKAQDNMGAMGWNVLISPSEQRKGGKHSAGLAFAARNYIGLRWPGEGEGASIISVNRLGHVVLEIPNWPVVHLFGAYLHVAEGLTERNVYLLAKLGEDVRLRRHYLVAADWNMWPAQIEASGFPRATQGTILRPPKGQVTCDTGRATSVIDVMVASSERSKAHKGDIVDMQWKPGPHRPFMITFDKEVEEAIQLVFRQAKAMPKHRRTTPARSQAVTGTAIGTATAAVAKVGVAKANRPKGSPRDHSDGMGCPRLDGMAVQLRHPSRGGRKPRSVR